MVVFLSAGVLCLGCGCSTSLSFQIGCSAFHVCTSRESHQGKRKQQPIFLVRAAGGKTLGYDGGSPFFSLLLSADALVSTRAFPSSISLRRGESWQRVRMEQALNKVVEVVLVHTSSNAY